jgi:hypothetical protein
MLLMRFRPVLFATILVLDVASELCVRIALSWLEPSLLRLLVLAQKHCLQLLMHTAEAPRPKVTFDKISHDFLEVVR